MSPQNWWKYTMGYKEAGDLLLENALHGGKQHVLLYPIVFLHRHYIELQLKEIILNNWAYLGTAEHFPSHHNIEDLWEICRDNFRKIDEVIDPQFTKTEKYKRITDIYDALEADVKRFAEWDPDSVSFRYPIDKRGNPILVDKDTINLKELGELINRISGELDGISVGAYEILKEKEDMNSYQDY